MPGRRGLVLVLSLVCQEAMAADAPTAAAPPMQAIQAATSRAAEMLGMKGQVGVIAAGSHADVIAVQGDPLRDIRVLEQVSFVMKDGKVFRNAPASR